MHLSTIWTLDLEIGAPSVANSASRSLMPGIADSALSRPIRIIIASRATFVSNNANRGHARPSPAEVLLADLSSTLARHVRDAWAKRLAQVGEGFRWTAKTAAVTSRSEESPGRSRLTLRTASHRPKRPIAQLTSRPSAAGPVRKCL